MSNQTNAVTTSGTSRTETACCSKCGQLRSISQLNGYDPLASTISEKYQHAYCRRLVDCSSDEAQAAIEELLQALSC